MQLHSPASRSHSRLNFTITFDRKDFFTNLQKNGILHPKKISVSLPVVIEPFPTIDLKLIPTSIMREPHHKGKTFSISLFDRNFRQSLRELDNDNIFSEQAISMLFNVTKNIGNMKLI
ncbi:uncharacterized protein LOC116348378 [Contarinia nasturtii]|uniref:uncharacterized protein LOC116348378 n=1 Tax=Contarinia nasturtii TaxID=265458 RepID=UPI0012D41185|nr:uncharacterized protein LOC116348378 [Contarinia nasturtii]